MNTNPIASVLALFALGVAIRMALRLYYGVRGPTTNDPTNLVLRVFVWVFLLSVGVAIAGTLLFVGLVLLVVLSFSFNDLWQARRRREQNAAWSIVNRAMKHGQPIAEMLQSNSGRFSGRVASAVRSFADDLSAAAPVESAIADNSRAFPPEAQACAALSSGGGPPLPRLATATRLESTRRQAGPVVQGLGYLLMVGVTAFGVATFVMIAIVPEFEKIFYEFSLELPPLTRGLIDFSNYFVNYWYLPIGVPMMLISQIAFISLIQYLFTSDTTVGRWAARLFYPWHRHRILNLLAVAVDERMPMDEAVRRLGTRPGALPATAPGLTPRPTSVARYPSALVRRRMDVAYRTIEAGGDWREALHGARLLSGADAELLRAAEPAGNTSWAMRSIAQRQLDRAVFRHQAWRQALFALLVLLFGAIVGWFTVALFVPLVQLIENLV